jgi:hypothetical protein
MRARSLQKNTILNTLKRGMNTGKIQGRSSPKFHTFHPKKYTKVHTTKKGVSPFHFVGFTEYLEQMSKQYKGLGKTDSRPGPIFGSRIVKKSGGAKGVGKWLQNFFNPNL